MTRPRIIIVGGGFGGLAAAKALKKAPAEIILIDRTNHHVFQPLLYQVATSALAPKSDWLSDSGNSSKPEEHHGDPGRGHRSRQGQETCLRQRRGQTRRADDLRLPDLGHRAPVTVTSAGTNLKSSRQD